MMIHESTQKLKKAWFRGHTNAKCEPQVMARKQFFAGLLQNILFCNSPSKRVPSLKFYEKAFTKCQANVASAGSLPRYQSSSKAP